MKDSSRILTFCSKGNQNKLVNNTVKSFKGEGKGEKKIKTST